MTPATFTVRTATALQRAALPRPQQGKIEQYAALAGAAGDVAGVLNLLSRAWSLPWDNRFKEPLWMLVLNGVPTPERFHNPEQLCGCGSAPGAGRAHLFHEYAAVQPLWAAIQAQICDAQGAPVALTRRHIWMAETPVQEMHQGVWDLVCVAAVAAMDRVRAYMYARERAGTQPGEALAAAAGRKGVADFFGNLADFCGLNTAPRAWRQAVPANHPFLTFDSDRQRWRVRRSGGDLSHE